MGVLRVVAPYSLVRSLPTFQRCFQDDCCDDGGSKHHINVGKLIPDYMAQQPRRRPSYNTRLCENPKSHLSFCYEMGLGKEQRGRFCSLQAVRKTTKDRKMARNLKTTLTSYCMLVLAVIQDMSGLFHGCAECNRNVCAVVYAEVW
jgi:hypothetical protein